MWQATETPNGHNWSSSLDPESAITIPAEESQRFLCA